MRAALRRRGGGGKKEEEAAEAEDAGAEDEAGDEEEKPKAKKSRKSSADDEDGDEDEADDKPKKKGKGGDDGKPKKGSGMMITIILGVLLLCCCGGGGGGVWFSWAAISRFLGFVDTVQKDLKKFEKDQTKKDDAKPAFTLTALAMTKEFLDDEKTALAKYQDRLVEVTGEIWSVEADKKGFKLKGAKKDAKDFLGVSLVCDVLPSEQDKLSRLQKDQTVKVVGKFIRSAGISIQISDCTVTELESAKKGGPAKTVSVSADQLAQEIDQDPINFKNKYFGQDVIVRGVVEGFEIFGDSVTVHVKAKAKTRILANFDASQKAAVRKGQTIDFSVRFENFLMQGNDLRIRAKLLAN